MSLGQVLHVTYRPGKSDLAAGRHSAGLFGEGEVAAGSRAECQQGV